MGPFLGSFEQEILTFRPYAKWLQKNGGYDKVFISSHFNRRFLYQDLPYKRFLPVYKQLTRQETEQSGYCHNSVNQKDFMIISKSLKEKVSQQFSISKKDLEVVSLPYVKYASPISIFNKIFEPINVPIANNKGNIVFIPDVSFNENQTVYIHNHLCDNYDVSVVGDMSCWLSDSNELLEDIEYLQSGYQKIITAITNAKLVITPCSMWTTIANLQKVPVVSWGDNVSPYRQNGMYHLGNNQCKVIYHDVDTRLDSLLRYIDEVIGSI